MVSNQFDWRVLDLTNKERALGGSDTLAIDSQLDRAANLHTDEMAQADSITHQLPDNAGLGERVSTTGYDWSRPSQNIANVEKQDQPESNSNDIIKETDDLPVNPDNQTDVGGFERRVVELVNQERAAAGLDALAVDSQLDRAADLHNRQMVEADSMQHQLPGEAKLKDRVGATGYNWSRVGENIAAGQQSPEEVVDGWMNSPGHRQNILNPEFTHIGIGYDNAPDDINNSNDYDTYWTQVFGTSSNI